MWSLDITESHSFFKMEVIETLRKVIDPELCINIIDMGLVYAVSIDDEKKLISVNMTLSSKHCPMGESILRSVQDCLEASFSTYQTAVNLVWEPIWSFDSISEDGKRTLGY